MKNLIRWPGLLAFILIFGGTAAFGAFFLDDLIKKGLTSALTEANQAEVNIAKVEIQWSPFAVTLENLEMTDPEKPTHNRFSAGRIAARVQFLNLLVGRVIVEELTASELHFDTERQNVGKVLDIPEKEDVSLRERLAAFDIELPTARSFLEGAQITTPQLVRDLENHFQERKTRFEQAKKNLPEANQLSEYETQITQLLDSNPKTPAELLKARNELKDIKKQIQTDQKAVSEFMAATSSFVTDTKNELQALKKAYKDDIEKARALFKFDEDSLTELSGLLFGPKVEEWTEYGLKAYELIAPLLAKEEEEETQPPSRWQGRYIEFDTGKVPSFWVKEAHLSLWMQAMAFEMDIQQLTWEHFKIGSPTRFQVLADKSVGWKTFDLTGEFSLDTLGEFSGQQQWQLSGVPLTDLELIGSSRMNTFLKEAQFDIRGDLSIKGTALSGKSFLSFADTSFVVEGDSRVSQYLGQALAGIKNFDINLDLAGQLTRPKLGLSSNLDHQMSAQFNQILSTEVQSRLAEVQSNLLGQTDGLTAQVEPWLKQIESLRAQGENFEETVQELLKAELDDLVESKGKDVLRNIFKKRP